MKLFLAALILLLTSTAGATTDEGRFATLGAGTQSCGAYLEARKKKGDDALYFANWVAGYVTSYNMWTPETYDVAGSTDTKGLLAWLDKYCQENPLVNFSNATGALIRELYPNRQTGAR